MQGHFCFVKTTQLRFRFRSLRSPLFKFECTFCKIRNISIYVNTQKSIHWLPRTKVIMKVNSFGNKSNKPNIEIIIGLCHLITEQALIFMSVIQSKWFSSIENITVVTVRFYKGANAIILVTICGRSSQSVMLKIEVLRAFL